MQLPQLTPTIGTSQPDPHLTVKIYDAVNSGSFAVILVAIGGLIYLKRMAREFIQSPFATSLLSLIKQIETNQEHIESIALDVDRLDKSTADMLDLVAKLQQEILRAGELSTAQHTMIMKELRQVRVILDRRGSKNVDNH